MYGNNQHVSNIAAPTNTCQTSGCPLCANVWCFLVPPYHQKNINPGAIQTDLIRNEYTAGAGLTLESVGQDLMLEAGKNLRLASERGSVQIAAFADVNVDGAMILLGGQVIVPGLAVDAAPDTVAPVQTAVGVCVCGNSTPKRGLLFQAHAGETCGMQVSMKAWGPCA